MTFATIIVTDSSAAHIGVDTGDKLDAIDRALLIAQKRAQLAAACDVTGIARFAFDATHTTRTRLTRRADAAVRAAHTCGVGLRIEHVNAAIRFATRAYK
jgi:hypothetical protein